MNILVTGGASGLGKAITLKLANNANNTVYFTYCKSKAIANEICALHTNVKSVYCNFHEEDSIEKLTQQLKEFNLDALINNAHADAINKNYFHKTDVSVFELGFTRNILPLIKITQEVIFNFRKLKKGKIITILTSTLVNKPPVGWSEYVASKAYIESLSKSWATENAAFNITANCISPSFMKTQLTSDIDERIVDEMKKNAPLKKLLTPEEVADVVDFYLNASQQINGTTLIVNSGNDVV